MPGVRLHHWTMPRSQTRAAARLELAAQEAAKLRCVERAARRLVEEGWLYLPPGHGPFALLMAEHPAANEAFNDLLEALIAVRPL